MLTITHINYIRDLYYTEGKSISNICEMTGRNYRTVKKYIEMEDFNESNCKAQRPNKSDVLRPIIHQWLVEDQSRHYKQRHTAKRIYARLMEEHAEILQVSSRTVRSIVKEEKEKLYGSNKTYLLLEHPGGEAQADFGTFYGYEQGRLKKFHELILTFPKSNAGFAVATRSETREALLEGLVQIFGYIGNVPRAIWFDQMSSAALKTKDSKGRLKAADFVMRFATHYGFAIKFCNANSGHEKGNVENKVGTIRRNLFVPEPTIDKLDIFNERLLNKCSEMNRDYHYRLQRPIETLFEEEKTRMIPFNKTYFDTCKYETRRVNKYGLIDFSGCRYSVHPKYVGQMVSLRVMANEIEILSKDLSEKITAHHRLFEKGQQSIHYIDFIDTIKTRPNALKYSGIYSLLPYAWRCYLESLDKENLKSAFNVLKMILVEEDLAFADQVLQETNKQHTLSPQAILITYKRMKENQSIYEQTISFASDLPAFVVDTTQYDRLMGGGM